MFERFQTIRNAPMRDYTTLHLGGPADWLITPKSSREIVQILSEARDAEIPVTVIGHGSNLLVLDKGIRGAVIRLAGGIRTCFAQGNLLVADAGAMMGTVSHIAAKEGLTGLEFASGIPGTIGGGVVMNAGAYGGEMSQVVQEISIIHRDGTMETRSSEEIHFGYRRSALQSGEDIINRITFRLEKANPDIIMNRMAELNQQRAEKQPLDIPSAGSTFKRPEGAYAAALIDQCGLKGYAVGGAKVSPKHAGFLVNTGNSAKDYLELIRNVQQIVEERTGYKLELEIRVIGE